MTIQNPDDPPLQELLGAVAEREAIAVINPALVHNRAKTFKALLREPGFGTGSNHPELPFLQVVQSHKWAR